MKAYTEMTHEELENELEAVKQEYKKYLSMH